MTRYHFREIFSFIHFDLRSPRSISLQAEEFALVSEVWNRFVDYSFSSYKPEANITMDEQLFPIKANGLFTQHMPNKLDKFGMKFWLAVDMETKYILKAIRYLGNDESHAPAQRLLDWVVMSLMEPFLEKGRKVATGNSYFR